MGFGRMAPRTSRSRVPCRSGKTGGILPLRRCGDESVYCRRIDPRSRRALMIPAAVVWTLVALGSQSGQSGSQSPPPTALIVGRVVDGSSGRPISGAIVNLDGSGPTGPAGPGRPDVSRQPRAMTNANGQFVFRKLAKGSYSLSATRPGYVRAAYGQKKPSGMSAPLRLEEGERAADVVIAMWRHAVISGTVTDEAGEPVIGVQVRLFQQRTVAGRRRVSPDAIGTTDDRGAYRIAGLAPGDYLVAFIWRETSVPIATAELMRGAMINDPKIQTIMQERMSLGPAISMPGSPVTMQIGGAAVDLPFGAPVPPAATDTGALFIYPTQF